VILTVPQDRELFPTLGPQVCDFIEQNLVFGPGDLRGEPVVLDDEKRALVYRFYEVYPKKHAQAGRRRFKRCGLSLRKGLGKTEFAAMIAACELHPEAPVRCTGFTKHGDPIGGPVNDPYIPFVAFNAEQAEELAYTALRVMLEDGPLKDDFDIGLERITRKKGDGKAVSLSSNPNARDGARTTFSVMDETHRWTLMRLRQAHTTMLNNLAKRKMADPWMLEVTTAPEPGAGSVAESTMEYAEAVRDGRVSDAALFYFHRQASDTHDLTTADGARAAVLEASGIAAGWTDVEAILSIYNDPTADKAYWERVWCNRLVKSATQAFDPKQWKRLAQPREIAAGRLIVLGFDGAMFHDSVALVAVDVETGYIWLLGVWECPYGAEDWQAPTAEIDALVAQTFERYRVFRMHADPPYWQSWIAKWSADFGKDRVVEWWTNRRRPMAAALEGFQTALRSGSFQHSGDDVLKRHLANSRRLNIPGQVDEQGRPIWLIQKDRPDSPRKIDAAMAAVLAWEARTDAIADGAIKEKQFQMFVIGPKGKS
jgi:hypothetical protein